MFRRNVVAVGLLFLLAFAQACTNKKVQNPLANVGSKQPDKVLFDRAMNALKHNKFDVARLSLQTLINTYPDSEYIARAKLAVGDSWYAEGGTASLQQAESEYKDFITFFPNMAEASEAQLKIANIHYQQMEKPDRDYTHALRAEDEYRQLILQYPDSKLIPVAKERLREVQEVMAEREYRIGRFYFLRQSWPASIARLKGVTERYPLYSKADDALYMLGQSYEGEVGLIRQGKLNEVAKGKMINQFTDDAAQAYSKIITRYPIMGRTEDAKKRLQALHRPTPSPTPTAIAQNKTEEASRRETGMFGRMVGNFTKHPDTAQATKIGEPTLVDPRPTSATDIAVEATRSVIGPSSGRATSSVSVERIGTGVPSANQPVPHTGDAAAPASPASENTAQSAPGSPDSAPAATGDAKTAPAPNDPNAIPELTPNVSPEGAAPDAAVPNTGNQNNGAPSNGAQNNAAAPQNTAPPAAAVASPNPAPQNPVSAPPSQNGVSLPAPTAAPAATEAPAAAPAQVNEAAPPAEGENKSPDSANSTNGSTAQDTAASGQDQNQGVSSSRPKKKKGLKKIIPF